MKPRRTFGLSLAIFASVMLFSIIPLIQVSMILIVQFRLQNAQPELPFTEEGIQPIAMGGDYTGVPDFALFLQVLVGLGFLIISIFAWVGRPPSIRLIMLVAVCGLTLLTVIVSLVPILNQPSLQTGLDAGNSISRTLSIGRIFLSTLVPLYVIWYMNRAPARAFYRGYYLPQPAPPQAETDSSIA